jgi:hypothetical protein
MVLKNLFVTAICAALLVWSGLSMADEYRPDEFLGLDLSKVVLSPKPLGPPAQFVPGPLDVKVDRGSEAAQAGAEPKAEPTVAIREPEVAIREPKVAIRQPKVAIRKPEVAIREPKVAIREPKVAIHEPKVAIHETKVVHARAEKPRGAARTKLARRHGNPLDAQAFDTRIQTWPCQSGGICNWKR